MDTGEGRIQERTDTGVGRMYRKDGYRSRTDTRVGRIYRNMTNTGKIYLQYLNAILYMQTNILF